MKISEQNATRFATGLLPPFSGEEVLTSAIDHKGVLLHGNVKLAEVDIAQTTMQDVVDHWRQPGHRLISAGKMIQFEDHIVEIDLVV